MDERLIRVWSATGTPASKSAYIILNKVFGDGLFSEDEGVGALMANGINRMPAIRAINELVRTGGAERERV